MRPSDVEPRRNRFRPATTVAAIVGGCIWWTPEAAAQAQCLVNGAPATCPGNNTAGNINTFTSDAPDTATLRNSQFTLPSGGQTIDGKGGRDNLTLDNSEALRSTAANVIGWEDVLLTNGSSLELGPGQHNDFLLGTAGITPATPPTLSIDPTSALSAGNVPGATIGAADGVTLVTVINQGTIDLSGTPGDQDAPGNTHDRLEITGNYTGGSGANPGILAVETDFGNATSDGLAIVGGTATGSTKVAVEPRNLGNATGTPIRVVDAVSGATTEPNSFFMDPGTIAAGAFNYELIHIRPDSDLAPANLDDWFLRPGGGIEEPCGQGGDVGDGGGGNGGDGDGGNGNGGGGDGGNGNGGGGDGPGAGGDGNFEGPFRPEVALYIDDAALALRYGSMLLDTLHQRKGDDRAAAHDGPDRSHLWGRTVGRHGQQACRDEVETELDYDLFAVQGGLDLYYAEGPNGESNRAGILGAFGTGSGYSSLFDRGLGSNNLNAFTMGGYWTHYGSGGWYLDALLQGTWYNLDAESERPFAVSTSGFGVGASLEAGYPIPLSDGWLVEPQAQLSFQHIDIDDADDGAATVSYSDVDSLVGRVGARLARTWELDPDEADPWLITGWLRASYAYEFLGEPVTAFGPVSVDADYSGPSVILNAGLDADLSANTSLYGSLDYEYQFDDVGESIGGEIGLKMRW